MDNAQKKALEVYPEPVNSNYPDTFDGYEQFLQDSLTNSLSRACFAEGYREGEKGLKEELNEWLDIMIDLCESNRFRTERETFEQVKDKIRNL